MLHIQSQSWRAAIFSWDLSAGFPAEEVQREFVELEVGEFWSVMEHIWNLITVGPDFTLKIQIAANTSVGSSSDSIPRLPSWDPSAPQSLTNKITETKIQGMGSLLNQMEILHGMELGLPQLSYQLSRVIQSKWPRRGYCGFFLRWKKNSLARRGQELISEEQRWASAAMRKWMHSTCLVICYSSTVFTTSFRHLTSFCLRKRMMFPLGSVEGWALPESFSGTRN